MEPASVTAHSVDLSGEWELCDPDTGARHAMPVPGDAISALVSAGVIPEPYAGRNEVQCRWVAERDWILERSFDVPGAEFDLVIDGLDTVAEVTINDVGVLSAANSFRRFRVDARAALKPGRNRIAIRFFSAVKAANDRQARQPFPVPFHAGNCPIANGNMLRKMQCDFGWDWNLALAPFGLYGAVRLEPRGAARIDDIVVSQTHAPDSVSVCVSAFVANAAHATLTLCGQTATSPVQNGVATARFEIRNPGLWWPSGLGAQTLHGLEVSAGDARATRRIGFRALEHRGKDPADGGFRFRVNGCDVFARGANWVPADALFSRITRESVCDLLHSAVEAGMNMIRVWGGGRYEPGWFYDICDELGILVWQDFMFACHLYPSDPDFLAEVDAEVRDQARRLNHHACLALWCGDNELVGALTWYPESRRDRDRYLVAYDRLNRTIEAALHDVLPDANWWPSSPSRGPLDFSDAWHDDGTGDMHVWSVWHEGREVGHYRDIRPRFCSEFGFQSFPSMEVIRRFAGGDDLNIASPVMEAHQKNAGGNARIAETMLRSFRFPERFPDSVYLSQVQQSLAIRTAVEYWRSLKPHCMGTLYWQLNDTWPVASWSGLDHGGGWKLLHHAARRFYAPVAVAAFPEGSDIALGGVNDTPAPVEVTVEAFALAMTGETRPLGAARCILPTDRAQRMSTFPREAIGPEEVFAYSWLCSDGSRGFEHLWLMPYKHLPLQNPGLSFDLVPEGAGWKLTLTSDTAAFHVAIEPDRPGRLSDNGVTITPDRPCVIRFVPLEPGPVPGFTIRDLWSATCRPSASP